MTGRIIISLLVLMAIFFSNSAEAQISIVGQNSPGVDIQAIQKGVDQGGTINLKGTFDFGNEGRVNMTKDVKIVGETDNGNVPPGRGPEIRTAVAWHDHALRADTEGRNWGSCSFV